MSSTKNITDKDYVIYAVQEADLLKKSLLGLRMFNPSDNRIEVIEDIFILNKKKVSGTLFNRSEQWFPVVSGVKVKYVKEGKIETQIYSFHKASATEWISYVIPKMAEFYRDIENQLKILNQ